MPTESVSLNFTQVVFTYTATDRSQGPEVTVSGRLHLLSQPLVEGGTIIGFRLKSNLMNAFASNESGTETYVAVGSSDGIPTECTEPCFPPSWTLTFRLVPMGPGGQSNLLFDLTVITMYGPDGSLESACVVGQEGCEVIP